MLIFQGEQAFSFFRLSKLLVGLSSVLSSSDLVVPRYYYFIDSDQSLSKSSEKLLLQLLPAGTRPYAAADEVKHGCWVLPRLGTVSPWSSKATEIIQNCGLAEVKRIERGIFFQFPADLHHDVIAQCYDPLTESVIDAVEDLELLFARQRPKGSVVVDIGSLGKSALVAANESLGLALSRAEIDYLFDLYRSLQRNPLQAELMMFAQVNSEHCRHKIFNAKWTIDDVSQPHSLFSMIRHTYKTHPDNVLIAYHDNAAVLKSYSGTWLLTETGSHRYFNKTADMPIVLKVETHNHPTAISPFPGAATGSGGEIRDEAATGRGATFKAGLIGFSVSDLLIPDHRQPWECDIGKPQHMASALQIMIEAPIGAAAFNNEFGRPNICGYFRTLLCQVSDSKVNNYHGYHKPIMLAGGIGNILPSLLHKKTLPVGAQLVVLGGPAFAIGLGGGSASSRTSSDAHQELDFASVQRANPEMQRRCQEVITACFSRDEDNPVLSIHDVGAGGLSNALPELVEAAKRGASLQLRDIIIADHSLSPVEIWCNESQERFVLAILPESLAYFTELCQRERCPFAVVGRATEDQQLLLEDSLLQKTIIDLPMAALFEKMPPLHCTDQTLLPVLPSLNYDDVDLSEAIQRVLQLPCVASKRFLITIGDRSVGGLVSRDQMVGPWQVPVADVAVTCADFCGVSGEAMAMGERTPIARLDHAASARMAVGEALTNIAAASIADISQISLSANWMAAPNEPGEGAGLYAAVKAIAMELCPTLGIAIPVGKDSLSMQARWQDEGQSKVVTAPLSLVVTAAAPVTDVMVTLTPELNTVGNTVVALIDLGLGHNALGGSAFAQVFQFHGGQPADVRDAELLKQFFAAIASLQQQSLLDAYHDRSDGGLLVSLCEMMFASHCGLTCDLSHWQDDILAGLFNEELGAVIQFDEQNLGAVRACFEEYGLLHCFTPLAEVNDSDELVIVGQGSELYRHSRVLLQRCWEQTSFKMQALRDNPECAQQEFDALLDVKDPGLSAVLSFDLTEPAAIHTNSTRPRVAILREQGVNGHREMAAVFSQVGFDAYDVHMSDLLSGRQSLKGFSVLVACGGFSYGDVLGAGRGWALTILAHARARDEFSDFFARADTISLGVCNGCQMLSQLRDLIPGAAHWPSFKRNLSEQFEARYSLVKIEQSNALLLQGMGGSVLPVVVSHGEGQVAFENQLQRQTAAQHVALRYVDHYHDVSTRYPCNPNGSVEGITGLASQDGRALIMMPHPERVFRAAQCSWHPADWTQNSPWERLFRNARDLFC